MPSIEELIENNSESLPPLLNASSKEAFLQLNPLENMYFKHPFLNKKVNLVQILAALGKTEQLSWLGDALWKKAFIKAINAAFSNAAANGHLKVLQYLEEKAPDELQDMIQANSYNAFRFAAANGHLDVLKHLEAIAPDKRQDMIQAQDYVAFRFAALNGHLEVLQYLLSKSAWQYAHAEIHHRENGYRCGLNPYTKGYLETLFSDLTRHTDTAPFDFPPEDKARALKGYFVLRYLIRTSNDQAFMSPENRLSHINRLLNVPGIKALVVRNATNTELREAIQGQTFYAEQPNELLRLAQSTGNRAISARLLTIVAIRDAAIQNNYYQGSHGLDLRALSQSAESSMTALTPEEQEKIRGLQSHYQAQIDTADKVSNLINGLKDWLASKYRQPENQAHRTVQSQEKTYELPLDYESFQTLIQREKINPEDALHLYYKNPWHTAWRYLSKPNPWISENASYVYVMPDNNGRYASFEEYKTPIALLWLAASDEKQPPTEQSAATVENRRLLFVQTLALINRAHNWDKHRPTGQLDDKNNPITEEYDDLEPDKPSCFSGVNRRLMQGLLFHPLYQAFSPDVINQLIRDKVTHLTHRRLLES